MKGKTIYHLTWTLMLLPVLTLPALAQNCFIVKDSIIAGSRASAFSRYEYDNQNRIVRITHTDSAQLNPGRYDTVYYNSSGQIDKIETYMDTSGGTWVLWRTTVFTYSAGKLSRIQASGTNSGTWTMAHDILYDGSGQMQSIVIDQSTTSGNIDGFPGSFIDMVWQNGNVTQLKMVIGSDTIPVGGSFDNKPNVLAKRVPVDGAPDILQRGFANNLIELVTLAPASLMGVPLPANTKLIDREYTYNTDNNVETFTEKPSVFEENSRTTQYFWNCITGMRNLQNTAVQLFPNPAVSSLHISAPLTNEMPMHILIRDLAGKGMMQLQVPYGTAVDVSRLQAGIYFIEISAGNFNGRSRFIKQ
ncbi:MAG: hypothetical protein KatS3mg031_2520 [Chitinophagales bacterium]|nr:MAG: hypothetical protein KatS3mg031_2520 [Chitinophagales bacterium]